MDRVNVLILAGGGDRVFSPINGKAMVEYVVDAVCDTKDIGDIAITGDVDRLKSYFGDRIDYYIQDGDSLFTSVERGLGPFLQDRHVIIVTADIPMIKSHMINEFIIECQSEYADLYYPIVEKGINAEKFSHMRRTYIKLEEGQYTGGNIVCINPRIIGRCKKFIYELMDNRKKPWKIGKMLGLRFLILLLAGKLTIPAIEQQIYETLNVKAKAIISCYGEIANDIDRVSDIELISKYFHV